MSHHEVGAGKVGEAGCTDAAAVRPVRAIKFGDGLDGPSRGDGVRPGVHEGVDGVIAELVLEDDEASRLRA